MGKCEQKKDCSLTAKENSYKSKELSHEVTREVTCKGKILQNSEKNMVMLRSISLYLLTNDRSFAIQLLHVLNPVNFVSIFYTLKAEKNIRTL